MNGNCQPIQTCGQGEEWSGYNCVCKANYERIATNYCSPLCQQGYQRNIQGACVSLNCPLPHRYGNGVCICASGYELNPSGSCVQTCQPGYARNSLGYCVPSCTDNKILVGDQCMCTVGWYNINGACKRCPEYSTETSTGCICTANNIAIPPGATCPVPQQCADPNTYYNPTLQICSCRAPAIWTYGGCRVPQTCASNEIWTGYDCVCVYGYFKTNGVCQPNNQ